MHSIVVSSNCAERNGVALAGRMPLAAARWALRAAHGQGRLRMAWVVLGLLRCGGAGESALPARGLVEADAVRFSGVYAVSESSRGPSRCFESSSTAEGARERELFLRVDAVSLEAVGAPLSAPSFDDSETTRNGWGVEVRVCIDAADCVVASGAPQLDAELFASEHSLIGSRLDEWVQEGVVRGRSTVEVVTVPLAGPAQCQELLRTAELSVQGDALRLTLSAFSLPEPPAEDCNRLVQSRPLPNEPLPTVPTDEAPCASQSVLARRVGDLTVEQ